MRVEVLLKGRVALLLAACLRVEVRVLDGVDMRRGMVDDCGVRCCISRSSYMPSK